MKTAVCHITKKHLPLSQLVLGGSIRHSIFELIQADYPDFKDNSFISISQLNRYRKKYLENMLSKELGELSTLEQEVLESFHQNELLLSNIEEEIAENLSVGDRMADRIATFGGSWLFIGAFFLFILLWMAVNIFLLTTRAFDPYPFILLNLILSCLAAIQAPIIMMSQNRQEAKDRQRSQYDY